MQYLVSVIDDLSNPGPPSDMAAIGAFNERLRAEGYWVFANGLSAPGAATVRLSLSAPSRTTGSG